MNTGAAAAPGLVFPAVPCHSWGTSILGLRRTRKRRALLYFPGRSVLGNQSPHFSNDEVTQIHALGRLRDAALRARLDRGDVGTQRRSHIFLACNGQVFEASPLP